MLAAFAERAAALDWVRPELADEPLIEIEAAAIRWSKRQVENFIANDARLGAARQMLLVTGPNMGGKSTYMRQVALIALLAYCGSFVPAQRARLGPIDQIFTRIGAADDLAGGRSTFMVEMTEAAYILHHATRAEPGADGRDRPRHLDLRRTRAGVGDRAPPGREATRA